MSRNIWNNISTNQKTFIIAEIGVNHNGDMEQARKLINEAKYSGADAVKFQSYNTEKICTKNTKKSKYQLETTNKKETFYEMLKSLELNKRDHVILKNYAEKNGIIFFSTPLDIESVDLLDSLNVPLFKIASGDINNLPLIDYVASKNKPMIVSTGRSTIEDINDCINTINKQKNKRVAILQCVSNYPASFEDLNLNTIITLKNKFNLPIGFSDHSVGIEASIAAVALGASIVEKHLTLDKNDIGPDHRASIEPSEFKNMVNAIRNTELALGNGIKRPMKSELWGRINVRKGLVANQNIPKGKTLTNEMISVKRPGDGIKPKYFEDLIGKITLTDIKKDESIKWEMLKR